MPKMLRSVYLDAEHVERLKKLSEKTKVPQSVYIRDGIESALKKHEGRNDYGEKTEG